jgi:acyl-coenzyme A thioesterase PaaI-like protein
MKLSPRGVKWMMNLYPPLLFNRIVVKEISHDFLYARVVIKKSFLNRNLNGTIFGGTLFSAADPFFSVLYWQIFLRKKKQMEAWVRAIEGNYLKPANTNITLEFKLSNQDIDEAEIMVEKEGRIKKWHTINLLNNNGEICVEFKILVYMRKAHTGKDKSVF